MQTSARQFTHTCNLSDSSPALPTSTENRPLLVTLVDGSRVDIRAMSTEQLVQLQCEQEPAFARSIVDASKDSELRRQVTSQAYTSVCALLEQLAQREPKPADFCMGMDARYSELVLRLLRQQTRHGIKGSLFEIGFSSGVLLETVARAGYSVGGLEVVDDLLSQAKKKLDVEHHPRLLLGDFRQMDLSAHRGRYSIVYWNDVFEHIPQDEILDYLQVIHGLLSNGGMLVTITPNWHMRPSDVTVKFCPPRTEAVGFHLKEYKLAEICELTHAAGFRAIRAPAFISRRRIYDLRWASFTRAKKRLEPLLERLPYSLAVQACRRLGFNLTIATK